MRRGLIFLLLSFSFIKAYSQEWVIIDIVSQNSKELVVYIDDGEKKIQRKNLKILLLSRSSWTIKLKDFN